MKIFLIRHGRTNEAEAGRRQFPHSPLSDKGILEAQAAASRLQKEEIDLVLTSEWPRAKATAEIIADKIDRPFKLFPGIHEKENSPALHGISLDDPMQKEHDEELKNNFGNLDWKFRNEGESLRDLIQRVSQFRSIILEDFKDKNLAVVSHSGFIRAFIASCILGDNSCDPDCLNLLMGIYISNTGISLLEFDEDTQNWKIIYLNDHLHLRT